MREGIVALLIPFGAFLMVWGISYLKNKENLAMIAQGMNPQDKKRASADPSTTLRNGLMFMGAGLGLLLAIVFTKMFNMVQEEAMGVYFGLIALFGGMGMLGAYLYERKNPPSAS